MMLLHALDDYLYLSVPSRVDRIGLHVYIALLEPLLGFMVSVSSRVALTWKSRTVVLDDQFVVEIKNQKYVKIQGSHPTWLKLLQGHSRGTLSGSDGMQELKKKRDLEVLRQVTKKDADKDLFSGDEGEEGLKGIVGFRAWVRGFGHRLAAGCVQPTQEHSRPFGAIGRKAPRAGFRDFDHGCTAC